MYIWDMCIFQPTPGGDQGPPPPLPSRRAPPPIPKEVSISSYLSMWVDQNVLKLLAYLFEYTTELYETYKEYKATKALIS